MTGNNFKEKKVVPLIFRQLHSRSHLILLDRLTPKDVYNNLPVLIFGAIFLFFCSVQFQNCRPSEFNKIFEELVSLTSEQNKFKFESFDTSCFDKFSSKRATGFKNFKERLREFDSVTDAIISWRSTVSSHYKMNYQILPKNS